MRIAVSSSEAATISLRSDPRRASSWQMRALSCSSLCCPAATLAVCMSIFLSRPRTPRHASCWMLTRMLWLKPVYVATHPSYFTAQPASTSAAWSIPAASLRGGCAWSLHLCARARQRHAEHAPVPRSPPAAQTREMLGNHAL